MSVVDQKRIAKNTLLLYIRMGVIMLICFYTSRVILDTLGEVDFGLYNVIGGIVVAFSFLNGVMAAACNRYFAIEIGRNDYDALKKVFSLNITIFFALAGIILVLAETVGLWFLNAKMVIPPERHTAANWVYQFSILAFLVNMMASPYRSIIISKEKMKVYAYCSVIEAVLRLSIVFLLPICPIDKLILYAILMFLVSTGVSVFYIAYCTYFYQECRYSFFWDKSLFKEIAGYTGWQIIGAMAGIGRSQGLNIILNMFFGPIINAARGIAYQVYININQFVLNFAMAFNPQIYKSYAANERQSMMNLVFRSSKFSYYLILFLVLPVFLETPMILDIWLKNVPEYAVLFCRLMLLVPLIECMGISLGTAIMATGKVKWFQIVVNGVIFSTVIFAYLGFKFFKLPPEAVFIISIITTFIAQIFRIYFMKIQLDMPVYKYIKQVIAPCSLVTISASIIPSSISLLMSESIIRMCLSITASFVCVGLIVFFLGITKDERQYLLIMIKEKIGKSTSI